MNYFSRPMKLFVLLLTICMLLTACSSSDDALIQLDVAEIEAACIEAEGVFVEEYIECENISEETCTEMGGEFDECASACRHEPEGTICTAQCVLVCSFMDEE